MIIVLLLFFQSICLYCQRLVLHIHDRWINPKNTRLLKEAAELSPTAKALLTSCSKSQANRSKRRLPASPSSSSSSFYSGAESCRFCANTPQGYCRHHFHLQELELQQQQRQKRFWTNIVAGGGDRTEEQRKERKLNRELKRNLKNRLSALKPQNHQPTIINNTTATSCWQSNQSTHLPHSSRSWGDKPSFSTGVDVGNGSGNTGRTQPDLSDDIGYHTASTTSLSSESQSSSLQQQHHHHHRRHHSSFTSVGRTSSSAPSIDTSTTTSPLISTPDATFV